MVLPPPASAPAGAASPNAGRSAAGRAGAPSSTGADIKLGLRRVFWIFYFVSAALAVAVQIFMESMDPYNVRVLLYVCHVGGGALVEVACVRLAAHPRVVVVVVVALQAPFFPNNPATNYPDSGGSLPFIVVTAAIVVPLVVVCLIEAFRRGPDAFHFIARSTRISNALNLCLGVVDCALWAAVRAGCCLRRWVASAALTCSCARYLLSTSVLHGNSEAWVWFAATGLSSPVLARDAAHRRGRQHVHVHL